MSDRDVNDDDSKGFLVTCPNERKVQKCGFTFTLLTKTFCVLKNMKFKAIFSRDE